MMTQVLLERKNKNFGLQPIHGDSHKPNSKQFIAEVLSWDVGTTIAPEAILKVQRKLHMYRVVLKDGTVYPIAIDTFNRIYAQQQAQKLVHNEETKFKSEISVVTQTSAEYWDISFDGKKIGEIGHNPMQKTWIGLINNIQGQMELIPCHSFIEAKAEVIAANLSQLISHSAGACFPMLRAPFPSASFHEGINDFSLHLE